MGKAPGKELAPGQLQANKTPASLPQNSCSATVCLTEAMRTPAIYPFIARFHCFPITAAHKSMLTPLPGFVVTRFLFPSVGAIVCKAREAECLWLLSSLLCILFLRFSEFDQPPLLLRELQAKEVQPMPQVFAGLSCFVSSLEAHDEIIGIHKQSSKALEKC